MTLLLIRLARFASIAGPPAVITLVLVALFTVLIAAPIAGGGVRENRTLAQSILLVLPWTSGVAIAGWLVLGCGVLIERRTRILQRLLELEHAERTRLRRQREAAVVERTRVERDADECIRLIQP